MPVGADHAADPATVTAADPAAVRAADRAVGMEDQVTTKIVDHVRD